MYLGEALPFLALVAVGAAVQSVTGFAMGLIIMGGVTALGLADISFSAAVVSLISMANTGTALRRAYKLVDRRYWQAMILGLVPMTVVGVILLGLLSGSSSDILRMILGGVIIAAGVMLMLKPTPWDAPTRTPLVWMTGCAGGLIGGLYGAGGAPLAYMMYRQPLEITVIRATLLATFMVSTVSRTLVLAVSGQLTLNILAVAAIAVPLVVLVTVVTSRVAHHVPDKLVRQAVFVLLLGVGVSLILR